MVPRSLLYALSPAVAVALAACGNVVVPAESAGSGTGSDGGAGATSASGGGADVSVGAGGSGGVGGSGGAGTPSCDCPPGLVYRRHECVPTKAIGCGEPCAPGVTDCGELHTCDPCGAASSCSDDDCQPTCLFTGPEQGPIDEGVLRISPTGGPADQETSILIEGFPFYIGALMYVARVGDIETYQEAPYSTCSFTIKAPALLSGLLPVRVSQYGPMEPAVLAGFFAYGSPEGPGCVQPGFPCGGAGDCCSLPEAPTSCVDGRCAAQ